MTDAALAARNEAGLKECWPAFGARVRRALLTLQSAGLRPRVHDAWRSPAEQLADFKSGASQRRWGYHNATSAAGAPEALAVDIVDDDHPMHVPWAFIAAVNRSAWDAGLNTGVLWGLPMHLRAGTEATIRAGGQPKKWGWDPLHLEPRGLTIARARAGERPA
jgi:hypothetical protein